MGKQRYSAINGRRRTKRKKLITIGLSLLAIVIVLGGGLTFYFFDRINDTASAMHEQLDRNKEGNHEAQAKLEKKKPISILLLGVDEREHDGGRSDTMMVLTLNPEQESMYMFNIQRDTRTEIVGKGKKDKINHAYAYGGTSMSVETVENFLDIPIDYYVRVNMQAFSDVVDALGGVDVNNPLEWADKLYYKPGYVYKKGPITLDTGAKALGFVRMRFQDPRGDYGRNERQRIMLEAIIDKAASPAGLMKFNDLLDVASDNVKTNMTLGDINKIRKDYINTRKNIEKFEIKGKGEKVDGVFYTVVPEEERLAVTARVKEHLEIE